MTNTTIASGQSTSAGYVVSSGDTLIILSGGTALDVTISNGGTETLQGGTATGGAVYGTQQILSATENVTISGETIGTGGTVDVFYKSNTIENSTIGSGGALNINGNATGLNLTIAGGVIDLQSPKANLTGTLDFTGTGTLLETAVISAGSGDLAVISGFGAGDVIDLASIGSGATFTSTADGGDTIINVSGGSAEGGSTESFTFTGTSDSFALNTDLGGTGEALTGTLGSGSISVTTYPLLTSFTAGDIVMSVVGDVDGSADYTDNQAAPVALEEIDPTTGMIVGEMFLPQTVSGDNSAFSGEYGSSSEGILQLSGNGQSLVIMGYGINAAAFNSGGAATYGNAALAQSTSLTDQTTYTPVARVVADITYNGTVDTSTALYNVFNTNNPRSVATVNGSEFWISGQGVKGDTTQGVFAAVDGASSATPIDTATDTRTAEIYNGNLYVSQNSSTGTANIEEFTGLPTGGATPAILSGLNLSVMLTAGQANSVNTGAIGSAVNLSPEEYFFANATTLYVADGGQPKAGGIGDGGLQKWTLNPATGVWSLDYTLSAGLNLVPNSNASGTAGLIGLTAVLNADGTVTFYTTNSTIGDLDQTYLYTITDQLNASSLPSNETFSVVETAGPDSNIRGIALAPSAPSDITIATGVTSSGLTVSNGSTLTVQAGGTITGAVILSGGTAYVAGTDSGSLIVEGGSETVTGSATGDNVYGTQVVSGGVSGETIYDYGSLTVAAGGTASNLTADFGAGVVISGGVSGVVIAGGDVVLATSGAVLSGGVQFSGGGMLAEASVPAAGDGVTGVISGFSAGDAIALAAFSNAATLSTVYSGLDTVETVSSGGVSATFTFAGEYAPGSFELVTIAGAGGSELLLASTLTGAETISAGQIGENITVAQGGSLTVLAGGSLIGATVLSGGSAVISGTDSGTTIANGGTELVLGSGTVSGDAIYGTQILSAGSAVAVNETVYGGGALDLFLKGAVADGVTLLSGGALVVSGNATGENLVLNGGTISLESPKATLAGTIDFSGTGTLIETAVISAGYGDSAIMSGFTTGDVITLAALGTGASMTSSVSNGDTTLTIAGGSESFAQQFTFAGTYAADYFSLSANGELTENPSASPVLTIASGESAPADYTVNNGFTLDVLAGGTAIGATVLSGGTAYFAGTDASTSILVGGTANLLPGGNETDITIAAGGTETVNSGTITGGEIYGFQDVLTNTTGALITGETVQNGGTLQIDNKTNTAVATTILTGGTFGINGNATGENMVIAGGVIDLESPKSNLMGTLSFAGAGTLEETSNIDSGYGDLATITGFGASDIIDMASIGSGASLSSDVNTTLDITTYTITGGSANLGEIDSFTFSGTGLDFQLATDAATTGELLEYVYCFLPGTRILTPAGEVPVETLNIGDAVVTRFSGIQRLKWIGIQRYARRFLANNPDRVPVCVKAGALGPNQPLRDLYISPGHSMLVGETLVLAKNLVNGITVTQDEAPELVEYYALELDRHDCVIAEGAFSESFADGPGFRNQFHNAAEFYALYPDYAEPDALALCAPRPEQGPALGAALRPVVAQAAALAAPGALRGYIDIIAEDGSVEGWAQDIANPELPVLLEICLGEQVLGSVLACDYRADLAQAGIGRGYAMFSFRAPVRLSQAARQAVSIRRAGDGEVLEATETCRACA